MKSFENQSKQPDNALIQIKMYRYMLLTWQQSQDTLHLEWQTHENDRRLNSDHNTTHQHSVSTRPCHLVRKTGQSTKYTAAAEREESLIFLHLDLYKCYLSLLCTLKLRNSEIQLYLGITGEKSTLLLLQSIRCWGLLVLYDGYIQLTCIGDLKKQQRNFYWVIAKTLMKKQ